MKIEFVRLSRKGDAPVFMVWDVNESTFQKHNENDTCASWDAFWRDVKITLDSNGIQYGGRYHEDGDDVLREYKQAAPRHIQDFGKAPPPPASKANRWATNLGYWLVAAFFVSLITFALWSEVLRPLLGRAGLIEYKTSAQERYEAFLANVGTCESSKTIFSEGNQNVPALHIFRCANGEEKIWAFGIKKATKSTNGKWVLE